MLEQQPQQRCKRKVPVINIHQCIAPDTRDPLKRCIALITIPEGDNKTERRRRRRFCPMHHSQARTHYVRYKQLTQRAQAWYRHLMAAQQQKKDKKKKKVTKEAGEKAKNTSVWELRKLYGLLALVDSSRCRFTQRHVHPSCRDQGHALFNQNMTKLQAKVEKHLRTAFLSSATSMPVLQTHALVEAEDPIESVQQEDHERKEASSNVSVVSADIDAQVQAYLDACIAENCSERIQTMFQASELFERAFCQIRCLLERNKLLSGALLRQTYQREYDSMFRSMPMPVGVEPPSREDFDKMIQEALALGAGIAEYEEEEEDEEYDDEEDECERLSRSFHNILRVRALMATCEFLEEEGATVERSVRLVIEGMFHRHYAVAHAHYTPPQMAMVSHYMTTLWLSASSMLESDVAEWKVLNTSPDEMTTEFHREFVAFAQLLDEEIRQLDWRDWTTTSAYGSPSSLLDIVALRSIAIHAGRLNKTSTLSMKVPAEMAESMRLIRDMMEGKDVNAAKLQQLENRLQSDPTFRRLFKS